MNFSASLPPLNVNRDEALALDMEQSPTSTPTHAQGLASLSSVGAPLSGRVSPQPTDAPAFDFASFTQQLQSAHQVQQPLAPIALPTLSRQPTDPLQSTNGILSASRLRPLSLSLSPVHSPRMTPSQPQAPMHPVSPLAFPGLFRQMRSFSQVGAGYQGNSFGSASQVNLSLSVSHSASVTEDENEQGMSISPKAVARSPVGRKEPEERISNYSEKDFQKGLAAFAHVFRTFLESDDESDSDSEGEDHSVSKARESASHAQWTHSASMSEAMPGAGWQSTSQSQSASQSQSEIALSEGLFDHGRRGTKRKLPQNLAPGGHEILDEDVDPATFSTAKQKKPAGDAVSAGQHQSYSQAMRWGDRQLQGFTDDELAELVALELGEVDSE